jgi:hypothetical protein
VSAQDGSPQQLLSWEAPRELDDEQRRLYETHGTLPETAESRLGMLTADLMTATTLQVNLFRDADVVAERETLEVTPEGRITWTGSVRGEHSQVVLVAQDGALSGSVSINRHQAIDVPPEGEDEPPPYGELDTHQFLIDSLGRGAHIVRRLDSHALEAHLCATHDREGGGGPPDKSLLPADASAAIEGPMSPMPMQPRSNALREAIEKAVAGAKASPCVTNVLVVYTPAAQSSHGNIPLLAQQAVAQANLAYNNSQVNNLYLNLVGAKLVAYTESNTMTGGDTTDLVRLAGNGDGFMDIVHTWRNDLGADVVVLINNSLPSGIAGQADAILATTSTAFAVTIWNAATANYTFAHEVGHLQGARHNPEADPTTTPFPHGHGRQRWLWNYRTIMSYNCGGNGCPRVAHFSNPSVNYNGVSTGDNTLRNNAKVLRDTSCQVAAFKGPATLGWQYLWGNGGNNALNGWVLSPHDRYAVGDFNGDGTDELFTANPVSHWASILRYNGSGWSMPWSNGGSNWVDWWALGTSDRFVAGDFIPGNGRDELLGFSVSYAHLMVYNGSTWTTVWSNLGSGIVHWWYINAADRYLAARFDTGLPGERLLAINANSDYAHLMRWTGSAFTTDWSNLGNGAIFWWNIGPADRYVSGDFVSAYTGDELHAVNPNGWSHTNRFQSNAPTYVWGNGGSGAVHWWMIGPWDNYIAGNLMNATPQDEVLAMQPYNGWSHMQNYNGSGWQSQWGNLGAWNIGWWYLNPGDRCMTGDFANPDGWDELLCIQPGNGWSQLQRYSP